jgi:hypothetical protein
LSIASAGLLNATAMSGVLDEHGAAAIVAWRETKPDVYLMVVSKVIPRELNLKSDGLEAFVKVWEAISNGAVEPLRDDQPVR